MQIVQVMVGYILGNVDMLCWVMGKKKFEEMVKQKQFFLEGCEKNGIDKIFVENIFDLVEKFVGYGFNKLYLVVYVLVFYQILWLKVYYLVEFMVVVFIVDMQNIDKVVILVEECWNMKLDLLVLDVSWFDYIFMVNDQGQIVYGLGVIKGLGEGLIQSIVEGWGDGELYQDIFDFCCWVDLKKVNKCVMEVLICFGVMDKFGVSCVQLMVSIDKVVQQVDQ